MRTRTTTFALLLACTAAGAHAQTFQADSASTRANAMTPPTDPPGSVSLPAGGTEVPLVGPHGRPIVEVRVNGRGPYRFVVETGAAFTALTPEAAAALELAPRDTANPSVVVDSIRIGSAALRSFRVAIFPLGIPSVDGVLGLNAYRNLLLTVDYPRGRVRLDRGILGAANGRVRLALFPADDLWELDIEVAGKKGRAILDTQGAGAFNTTPGNAAGVPFEAPPVATGFATGPGIGTQQTSTARLAGDIRVGDVVFRRPLVGLVPMPPGYPVQWNMGGPSLREFRITLDQRSRVLLLARAGRAPVAAPPSLRSSGFRTQGTNGRRMVSTVTPGSEAERAGIAAGDEIVSVNGRSASPVEGPSWAELIQGDGPLQLVVRRAGTARQVTLTPTVQVK